MKKIIENGTSEIVEKKSRFLGYIYDVTDADDAAGKVAALKKKHYDARHVCYAYVIGQTVKSSDDGEPQGTAGRPITDVITHMELDHCLIAVVRYFGGILLGTGGLIRAYTAAASAAAGSATLMELHTGFPLTVTLDYESYGKADYFFNEKKIPRLGTDYGAGVTIKAVVPSDHKNAVEKQLAEISSGRAVLEWSDETTYGLVDGEVRLQ